ncbi:MAG: cofactor assembly of complex C subunit B [Jaaginema sp. PMC 1080.18]|nr:cofactor assembly of complex C subunit B [Jaaginema sp. PMC 1080.18]MEC4868773.1 cofactor assembly of complex C subunit B [Jaaginema sp. PMC 1078.18]
MAKSDPNRILRLLPLVTGGLGGLLLMLNRVLTPDLSASQSRSDVLGVILSALLILVGLIWQQIQPKSPDSVILEGEQGFEIAEDLPPELQTELAWATHLILTNTVTRSLAIYYQGRTILRRGVLGKNPQVEPGNILKRVLEKQKPVYLVALSVYPGRIEFDYLPENTQGVICQPLGSQGAMILGANAPRSYTKQDENWIEGIAAKLAQSFSIISD